MSSFARPPLVRHVPPTPARVPISTSAFPRWAGGAWALGTRLDAAAQPLGSALGEEAAQEGEEEVAREAGACRAGRVGLHSPSLTRVTSPRASLRAQGRASDSGGEADSALAGGTGCSCLLSPRACGLISGVCFLGDPPPGPRGSRGEWSFPIPAILVGLWCCRRWWWRETGERFRISFHRRKTPSYWGLNCLRFGGD